MSLLVILSYSLRRTIGGTRYTMMACDQIILDVVWCSKWHTTLMYVGVWSFIPAATSYTHKKSCTYNNRQFNPWYDLQKIATEVFFYFNLFIGSLTSPEKNVLKSDHGKVDNLHNSKMSVMTIEIYTIFCSFFKFSCKTNRLTYTKMIRKH